MNSIKLKSTVFRRRKPTKMLSAVKVDFYCTLQNMVIVLIIVMCSSRCVIVTHYQLLIETGCITISLRARQFQFYFTICILVCLYEIFELKKKKQNRVRKESFTMAVAGELRRDLLQSKQFSIGAYLNSDLQSATIMRKLLNIY